jgi:hypothetical protein
VRVGDLVRGEALEGEVVVRPLEIGTRRNPDAQFRPDPEVRRGRPRGCPRTSARSPIEWCIPPGSKGRTQEESNRSTCPGLVAAAVGFAVSATERRPVYSCRG